MNIAQVIGWKFNNQAGMSTKDGKITKFPGGMPTQQDQDNWTAEYKEYIILKNTLTSSQVRDAALAAIQTYDFEDGRVIQIRIKEDRDNLKGGIKKGQTLWKMLDNKVYSVTTDDLQVALDEQEKQIAAIWMAHFADLKIGTTN